MEVSQFLGNVNELRRGNTEYITNSVFTPPQLDEILHNDDTKIYCGKDLQAIFIEEADVVRTYLYARNIKSLSELPDIVPDADKPVIIDVVGKEAAAYPFASALCKQGFVNYSKFIRMICRQPSIRRYSETEKADYARLDESEQIQGLLRAEFDPLFAHIPTISELERAIAKNEISVIRSEGRIAGLAYFERISVVYVVLRFFLVLKKFRGQNIGGALLDKEFRLASEKTSYMLWIGDYNPVKTLYQNLGFAVDGMVDYILKYDNE